MAFPSSVQGISDGRRPSTPTRCTMIVHASPRPTCCWPATRCGSCPSTSGRRSRPRRRPTRSRTTRQSSAAARSSAWSTRRAATWCMEANKDYWRGAPKIDELIFQCYTNEDTMAQDLKAGTLDACHRLAQRAAADVQGRAGGHGAVDPRQRLHRPGLQLLRAAGREQEPRQPRAARLALPPGPAVGRGQGEDRRRSSTTGTRARATRSSRPATTRDPDWHWSPPADQAYAFDLAKAGDVLTAAGYPLKTGRASTSRAGRSRCACGPASRAPRARR